jgi:hypothetical protein
VAQGKRRLGGDEPVLVRIHRSGLSWSTAWAFHTDHAKGGFNVVSSPVFALSSGERMVVIEPMISGDLAELDHEAAVVFNRDGDDRWANNRARSR